MANQKKRASHKKSNKSSSQKKRATTSRKGKHSASRKSNSTTRSKKAVSKSKDLNKAKEKNLTPEEKGMDMGIDIQLVLSLGLMLILTFSNFGLCGEAGNYLSSFFFGLFGCVQYVIPVMFFIAVSLLIINEYSLLAIKKCLAGWAILMIIDAFVQIFRFGTSVEFSEIFSASMENHGSGGLIGGGLAFILQESFGKIGSIIILLCALVLAIIFLTQRSVAKFFKKMLAQLADSFHQTKDQRKESMTFQSKIKEKQKSVQEKQREKQCVNKVKELEEAKVKAQKEAAKKPSSKVSIKARDKKEQNKDSKTEFNVPTFHLSDEVKRKDSVKELHKAIYPFTEEDGKTTPFDKELDFSAFSFNSDQTPQEYIQELKKHTLTKEEMEQRVRNTGRLASKGLREIESTLPDLSEDDFSELTYDNPADAIEVDAEYYGEEIIDAGVHEELENESQEARTGEEITDPGDYEELDDESQETERKTSRWNAKTSEEVDRDTTADSVGKLDRDTTADPVAKGDKDLAVDASTENKADLADAVDIVIHKEDTNQKKENSDAPDFSDGRNYNRKKAEGKDYIFPPMNLLESGEDGKNSTQDQELKLTALKLEETLKSFGVNVTMTAVSVGPTVTRYEMRPEQGTKVSKIVGLSDDIKMNLAAEDIRIEAPIPGKAALGIEVPNKHVSMVYFRDLIDNQRFRNFRSKLAFAVGKDIGGNTIISDIAKMPHLLIAGATGSGKSVCINTLIMSILYKARPDEVKMIMIDPKMVELSIYNGIPHLLIPVVTDPKKAAGALNWAVAEMTDRYNKFTTFGVRNMEGYNEKVRKVIATGEVDAEKLKPLPQIVVIVDELADLMMVASSEVEDAIVRLTQLARAAGIHLVIATQRPSVNVITGLIKANVPSRIAFAVSSGVDSRTIIDMNGAEKLLGKGDMLFAPAGSTKPSRVQGAFISDEEITAVVEFLKENEETVVYDEQVKESIEKKIISHDSAQDRDEYFEDAARFLMEKEKASIGMLQRMFKIGFNRASRIMDQLSEAGIVGPEEGTKPRKIMMSPEQLEQYFEDYL